jgi:CHAT domain-containing protein
LTARARAFLDLYRLNYEKENYGTASLLNYQLASKLLDQMKLGFSSQESKYVWGELAHTVYEEAIQISLLLYRNLGDEAYQKLAFQFAEKSHANVLLQSLYESRAKKFANIPAELLDDERQLRIDLTYYHAELQKMKSSSSEVDSSKMIQIENTLFTLNESYQEQSKQFEEKYPDYYRLKYTISSPSLSAIQARLADVNSSIAKFFWGDSNIYIFYLDQDSREVITIPQNTHIAEQIRAVRTALINLDFERYLNNASFLYQILMSPLENYLVDNQKLIIMPDGILYYLPFEALITENAPAIDQIDFTDLPYLIKKYEISYQFSYALFMEKQLQEKKSSKMAFLGVAPVFSESEESTGTEPFFQNIFQWQEILNIFRSGKSENSKLPPLLYSTTEVKEIESLFSQKKYPVKVLLNENARENEIKSASIASYRYIHFATHGIINEEHPGISGIVLAPEDSLATEDGILFADEIYNLELEADLVVLSACESGLGKIVKGEGLLGLTRGFIYSGAHNIVVSLWQVADRSTAEFMIQFYQYILAGQSYPTALRNTKLDFIADIRYAYPLEWSPFILIGL